MWQSLVKKEKRESNWERKKEGKKSREEKGGKWGGETETVKMGVGSSREDSWEGEGRRDGREERKTKTPVMLHFLLGKTPKGALELMFPPQTSKDPGPAPTPAKHQTPFPQGQA